MRNLVLAATLLASAASVSAQQTPAIPGLQPQAEPYATEAVVNHPRTIGWPDGRKPVAPRGYEVVKFAGGLDYPRQALLLPNGDVLVAEARTLPKLDAEPDVQRGQALSKTTGFSANRITLLRDANRDGIAEQRFVLREGLNQPFGMQYANGRLYVANTDGGVSFPYQPGQTRITAAPRPLIALPAGGYNNHWTRNLLLSPDARTLYVSVGSASNVGEYGMDEEKRRAAILAVDLASGRERLYASGLRNPVGMGFANGTLWTAVTSAISSATTSRPTIWSACARAASTVGPTATSASRTLATPTTDATCWRRRCCPTSRSVRMRRRSGWRSPAIPRPRSSRGTDRGTGRASAVTTCWRCPSRRADRPGRRNRS